MIPPDPQYDDHAELLPTSTFKSNIIPKTPPVDPVPSPSQDAEKINQFGVFSVEDLSRLSPRTGVFAIFDSFKMRNCKRVLTARSIQSAIFRLYDIKYLTDYYIIGEYVSKENLQQRFDYWCNHWSPQEKNIWNYRVPESMESIVLKKIQTLGPIWYQKLLHNCGYLGHASDIDKILVALTEQGKIREWSDERKRFIRAI